MNSEKSHKLERLFYPRSIAVVGASSSDNSQVFGGNSPILGSIKQNFNGHIYPINPKAERILGYKAYPSVRDIPGEVDLIIFTPGPVPGNLMNMGAKGVDMFCRNMAEAKEKLGKPMVFVLERDMDMIRSNLMADLEKRFREAGLMVFPTFDLAAKALVNLNRYQEYLLTQKR